MQAVVHRLLFGEDDPEATIYEARARQHLARGRLSPVLVDAAIDDAVRREFFNRLKRDGAGKHQVTRVPPLYLYLVSLLRGGAPVSGNPATLAWLASDWGKKSLSVLIDLGLLVRNGQNAVGLTPRGRKLTTSIQVELGL